MVCRSRPYHFNFLKAVFHKFYLVHSWILWNSYNHCVKYVKYGISLTLVFLFKDRIVNFVVIQKSMGKRKPVFWHILHSVPWLIFTTFFHDISRAPNRNKNRMETQLFHTRHNYFKNSFFHSTISEWNNLDRKIRNSGSLNF